MDLALRGSLSMSAPGRLDRLCAHVECCDRSAVHIPPNFGGEVHLTSKQGSHSKFSSSLAARPTNPSSASLSDVAPLKSRIPRSLAGSCSVKRNPPRAEGGTGLADQFDQQDQGSGLDGIQVPSGTMMVPMMKKGFGAFGGGATLEKSKLDMSQAKVRTSPQLEQGGGGGNIGKGVFFGGGDGGDDGGDDDDYFGEDDGEDDGDDGFFRRGLIPEVFDKASVEAVLQEWFRTMKDLPAGLLRAVEMGLVSSAQLARFMSIDARPTIARVLSRLAPSEISRAFIGRMMADPAFIFKVVVEQAATVAAVLHWEIKHRGDRFKEEWDIALTNVLTVAVCNAAVVWCLSPTRSYGTTARSDWQNALQKLPNHMFDKSYPLREFNMKSRAGSFFYKAAELSLVGTVAGGVNGAITNALVGFHKKRNPEYKPSLPVSSTSTATAAYGAHMGLSGNLRYQLLYGIDRFLQHNFNHIPVAILGTTALRCGNVLLGEPSRLAWLGLDEEALLQHKAESSAYRRPSVEGQRQKKNMIEQVKSFVSEFGKGSKKPRARRAKTVKQKGAAESRATEEEAPVRRPKRKVKQRLAAA